MEPAVPWDDLLEVLKGVNVFNEKGELLKERDKGGVWQKASDKLDSKKTPHTIYIDVQQNRHGLEDDLKTHGNIKVTDQAYNYNIPKDDFSESGESETEDSVMDEEYVFKRIPILGDLQPVNIKIHFDEKEWAQIKPERVFYKDGREYLVLKEDWTDMVVEKVWKATKINCNYAFKNHQFYVSEDFPLFKFSGDCSECSNHIEGECPRTFSLDSESVSIDIHTFDSTMIAHKRKRKLKNTRRKKAKRKAQYVKAGICRLEDADNLLEYSDLEPAYLNNSVTMRKLRQEAIDEALKLSGPTAVFDSLLYLSENGFPEIREVSQKPFVVNVVTDDQIQLWKNLKKEQKLSVSIDASGGYARKVTIGPDEKSGYIFLYRMVTGFESKVAPLWQMLSDAHDTNTIQYALSLPISLGAPTPDNAATDGSLAMLNGTSMSFNDCPYKDYLDTGHRILMGESLKLKPCRLTMDRAHVMKSPGNWKCFNSKDFEVKDFYKRCIGYSITVESVNVIEDVLLSIFIIALSKHCTENSECSLRKTRLKNRIKTFNQDEYDENDCPVGMHNISYADIEDNQDPSLDILKKNAAKDFVTMVYEKALKMLDNQTGVRAMVNSLYIPGIVNNIIYLYSQYPAWTDCLKPLYGSTSVPATSARSEEAFKDDKNNHYINYPISANRCVLSLLISINGRVKLVKAALKNSQLEKGDVTKQNNPKQSVEQKKIGKAKPSARSEKIAIQPVSTLPFIIPIEPKAEVTTTMNPFETARSDKIAIKPVSTLPSIIPIEPNAEVTTTMNPIEKSKRQNLVKHVQNFGDSFLISNGIHCDTIIYDGKVRKFVNTCAFDSVSEILLCAAEIESVNKFISTSKSCEYLKTLLTFSMNVSLLDDFYEKRAKILYPIVIDSLHNRKNKHFDESRIDCQINVIDLVQTLLESNETHLVPSSKLCDKCGYKNKPKNFNTLVFPFREVPKITDRKNGMQNLQECLNDIFDEPEVEACPNCHSTTKKLIYDIQDIMFLETEYIFTSPEIKHTINSSCPESILIRSTRYQLIGVVEIEKLGSKLNHYRAYCLINNRWMRKDDLSTSAKYIDNLPGNIKLAMIVYAKSNE